MNTWAAKKETGERVEQLGVSRGDKMVSSPDYRLDPSFIVRLAIRTSHFSEARGPTTLR